jgi:quercetin dioxygenase-like cupin family protein
MRSRTRLAATLVILAVVAVALAGLLGGVLATGAPGTPEAKRDAMAQTGQVQGAPQRELVLSRVVVPPGAKLALHHHLGTQVARVESGVLTYTVQQGSVVVRCGQSDANPTVVRKIAAGQSGQIKSGQWIVEQPSDIHRAANNGSEPVVIYIATLLKAGAPPATPVG